MKDFLDTWKARVEATEGDLDEEAQVAELRRTAEEYKERFEGNAWVRGLMEGF